VVLTLHPWAAPRLMAAYPPIAAVAGASAVAAESGHVLESGACIFAHEGLLVTAEVRVLKSQ
jgi:hypothetical protein